MNCPDCDAPTPRHRVVFTRQTDSEKTIRRKKCLDCGTAWYSVEVVLLPDAVAHGRLESGKRTLDLAPGYRNILFQ